MRRRAFTVWARVAWLLCLGGCRKPAPAEHQPVTGDERVAAEGRLRSLDARERLGRDFAHLTGWDENSGPDPYIIAKAPRASRFVGLLRGEDAVVLLDPTMREVSRFRAPLSPAALDVGEDGSIWVGGERSSRVARFSQKDDELVAEGEGDLAPLAGIRAIASGPGDFVYLGEETTAKIWAFELSRKSGALHVQSRRDIGTCRGPLRIMRVRDRLIANCLLDHRLDVYRLRPNGAPLEAPPLTIAHDGPIWSFDAAFRGDDLLIALGGVEDHPLDRTIGAFGYIDSFLFMYRVTPDGRVVRERAVNLSELRVVTPKAIALRVERDLALTVTGYGSSVMADILFPSSGDPEVRTREFVPGTSSVASLDDGTLVFANPLLDAWVVASPRVESTPASAAFSVHRVPSENNRGAAVLPRGGSPADPAHQKDSAELRLGEALFFTTLMAPFNRSDGPLSRFTCETCHFEGYVDGRIHHTGRDQIHAVTKPLLGLFNNRPHFSRALDPDLTAVVFNEFRVAGAKSDHDPWFSIAARDYPWIAWLDPRGATDDARESHVTSDGVLEDAREGHVTSDGAPVDASDGTNVAARESRATRDATNVDASDGATSDDAHHSFSATLGPEHLRTALMKFLIAFQHRPNPALLGRSQWSEEERRGAELFRDRCERCHEARLSTDLPTTRASFDRWETLVMSREGPIVWASDVYARTGVVPYVHEKGARVPSLRRLYKKYPYFTNGSATTLDDVLSRVRIIGNDFRHDSSGEAGNDATDANVRPSAPSFRETLSDTERTSLLAFLRLL